ncbi:MAG: imidazole glycerol phosphate synthase subunit HisH [Ruminococcus sp.]|jgi:glutamine amidotransferase|nr:imidazole glycerol phosphate synthase subunit HisH [Ruminococcus sp.]
MSIKGTTAIVDYDAGNIFSVKNALDFLGENCVLTDDKDVLKKADRVILPGVGAFPAAMESLRKKGLTDVLRECAREKPFLGICLGMQVLFSKGFEFSETEGLALIPGEVRRIPVTDRVIPHMGWNRLEIKRDCPIVKAGDENYVYFVHSFMGFPEEISHLAATVSYGIDVTALVWNGLYTFGAQFHPEKSGETGLEILRRFVNL